MREELLQYLPRYNNVEKTIIKDQSVNDIINGILKTHELYKKDYDKIAHKFLANNNKEIGKKLWKFLKKNVPYKIEPENKQTLRSPAAILASLRGADCKSYSLFIAGNLSALQRLGKKINWVFRFSSYRFFDPEPQHVFIVIDPDSDNEIWIDPVLNEFNYKKQYYYHKDKKPMALVSLSGVGATKQKIKKPVLKKAAEVLKKGGQVVLKIAASPSRNAFLALVSLNVFGLATKLKKANELHSDKLNRFWASAGGNTNNLLSAIKKGSGKKRILGSVAIGEPATASIIAAATPLLIKVADFLKKIGIDPEELKKLALDKAKQLADNQLKKLSVQDKEMQMLETEQLQEAEKAAGIQDSTIDKKTGSGMDYKKIIPFVLIGGAAIYFISKKK